MLARYAAHRVFGWVSALAVALGGGSVSLLNLATHAHAYLAQGNQAIRAAREFDRRTGEATEDARKAELAAAERELAAAQRDLLAARTEWRETTPLERLDRFIREKATGGDYARHLGLVATIRRDFQTLARMMAAGQQEDATATGGAPRMFDRIVLFIDDLDRCPHGNVVEVLQAVHLLLAFPLFVVVVAVDYRWVAAFLREAYPSLLTGPADARGEQPMAAASPGDYLEKIFQIPYWTRPVEQTTSQAFVRELVASARKAQQAPPAAPEQLAGAPVAPRADPEMVAQSAPGEVAGGPAAGVNEAVPADEPPGEAKARVAPLIQTGPIEITEAEETLLATLAPHAGRSPSQLKRFFNIYRVIKASQPAGAETLFLGENGAALPWRAAMGALAMATRAPERFEEFATALAEARARGDDWPKLRTALGAAPAYASDAVGRGCLAILDAIGAEPVGGDMIAALAAQARVVARFSFTRQERFAALALPPGKPVRLREAAG